MRGRYKNSYWGSGGRGLGVGFWGLGFEVWAFGCATEEVRAWDHMPPRGARCHKGKIPPRTPSYTLLGLIFVRLSIPPFLSFARGISVAPLLESIGGRVFPRPSARCNIRLLR